MQREREGRNDLFDMGHPFSTFRDFGGFGPNRSMMPSLFSGRDPFDDPFFTRPFDSMFEPSVFDQNASLSNTGQDNKMKGIVIEELDSDHEGEKEDKGNCEMLSDSSKEPSVEHPDDDADVMTAVVDLIDGNRKEVKYKNQYSKVEGAQPRSHGFGFQTCKVTYGGIDGAYYASTRTRRTGKDGVVIEESKEADTTSGQATHRISRGIHSKGHTVTRKLNSDGKVDTMQTLHNLNEDELGGFEEAWKGNANKHLPCWSERLDMLHGADSSEDEQNGRATSSGWALPSSARTQNAGATTSDYEASARTSGPGGRTKKVVRINIE